MRAGGPALRDHCARVLLFLLALRRSGENTDRLADGVEITEKVNAVQRHRSTRRLFALLIATIRLSGCATGAYEPSVVTVCPLVVKYSRKFQIRVAEEHDLPPERSAIAETPSAYVVMREQARACEQGAYSKDAFESELGLGTALLPLRPLQRG